MASYRLGQAAWALGVSVDTLRRWVDTGKVPCTRTAGRQRVLESDALARLAIEMAPGVLAVASIKSTSVVVERPA